MPVQQEVAPDSSGEEHVCLRHQAGGPSADVVQGNAGQVNAVDAYGPAAEAREPEDGRRERALARALPESRGTIALVSDMVNMLFFGIVQGLGESWCNSRLDLVSITAAIPFLKFIITSTNCRMMKKLEISPVYSQ
jgi:hypothetical protein